MGRNLDVFLSRVENMKTLELNERLNEVREILDDINMEAVKGLIPDDLYLRAMLSLNKNLPPCLRIHKVSP